MHIPYVQDVFHPHSLYVNLHMVTLHMVGSYSFGSWNDHWIGDDSDVTRGDDMSSGTCTASSFSVSNTCGLQDYNMLNPQRILSFIFFYAARIGSTMVNMFSHVRNTSTSQHQKGKIHQNPMKSGDQDGNTKLPWVKLRQKNPSRTVSPLRMIRWSDLLVPNISDQGVLQCEAPVYDSGWLAYNYNKYGLW